MRKNGFSLVELSIVLVILGLLVGVLSGQSLIRASEQRSISADIARYMAATNTFRDKYFAMPGDMTNATMIWGKDNANCSGNTGTAATPGTCNGDGDGRIAPAAAINATGESFQFWKQLALAGMIEGNYTGLCGPNHGGWDGIDSVLGSNVPRSRISNVGYAIMYLGTFTGNADSYRWDGNYGSPFMVGQQSPGNWPEATAFKPEESWNLDTKMDDGIPSQGRVRSYRHAYGTYANCTTVDSQATAAYNLGYTSAACQLIVLTGF